MKKLILAAVLLSGMTFVACSSDDDNGLPACVTCVASGGGMEIEIDLCREDFDTQAQYEAAVQQYRDAGANCR